MLISLIHSNMSHSSKKPKVFLTYRVRWNIYRLPIHKPILDQGSKRSLSQAKVNITNTNLWVLHTKIHHSEAICLQETIHYHKWIARRNRLIHKIQTMKNPNLHSTDLVKTTFTTKDITYSTKTRMNKQLKWKRFCRMNHCLMEQWNRVRWWGAKT